MDKRGWDREELRGLLLQQVRRCPAMAPRDAVKLLYQNEFGGGHLLSDPERGWRALEEEARTAGHDPACPLWENIGGGMVRVNLRALGADHPLEELWRDMLRSARRHGGDRGRFLEKLELLGALTASGAFGFSPEELEGFLEDYLADGCLPVSHSPAYRSACRPAYRVVEGRYSLTLLVGELLERAGRGEGLLVALDGRCAAGKTTLARMLGERYGWPVVHLDHFFLRPEQRTPERYAVPGENVDHERFLEQVLLPLEAGRGAVYRPFLCHTGRLGEPIRVSPGPVTIVEGSYACHRVLWDHYDLHVFLTVDPALQRERILKRNGPEGLVSFAERWIPLEEAYFAKASLEERCGYVLDREDA